MRIRVLTFFDLAVDFLELYRRWSLVVEDLGISESRELGERELARETSTSAVS